MHYDPIASDGLELLDTFKANYKKALPLFAPNHLDFPFEPSTIDIVFAGWLKYNSNQIEWIVPSIAAAFGEFFIHKLSFQWQLETHDKETEIILHHPSTHTTIYIFSLVANKIHDQEIGFAKKMANMYMEKILMELR